MKECLSLIICFTAQIIFYERMTINSNMRFYEFNPRTNDHSAGLTTEDTSNSITLSQLYTGNFPDDDELIWNFVGTDDFEIPFTIYTISPQRLAQYLTSQYHIEHIDELFDMMDDDQKEIVDHYTNDPLLSNQIIVMSDGRIIDGNHRALAAVLTKTSIKYIDVSEEVLNEIGHASELQTVQWKPEYAASCEIVGETEGLKIHCMPTGNNKMFMILDDSNELEAYVIVGHSSNFPDRMNIRQIDNVSGRPGLATTLVAGLRKLGAKFVIDSDEPLTNSGLEWVLSLIKGRGTWFNITDQHGDPIDPVKLAKERINALDNRKSGLTSVLIEFDGVVMKRLNAGEKQWLTEGIAGLVKPPYLFIGDGRLW